jgi:transposase
LAASPGGYGYSRYCDLHRIFEQHLSPTMRQTHVAGKRMFVDYSGTKMSVVDGTTGEILTAELFVAVLGTSNFTYAKATWTQSLPDWIGSHTRAFSFFDGVTAMVVSNNLMSGVIKACFYEPKVNRTYAGMAKHYDTAIVPARPYKPKDKPKVEVGVQVAQRWIIAKLRNCTFFSLAELNAAIRQTSAPAAARCLKRSSVPSSSRCRPRSISSPSGRNAVSASTTTWRLTSTTTRRRSR